jgi:hypothetical protein
MNFPPRGYILEYLDAYRQYTFAMQAVPRGRDGAVRYQGILRTLWDLMDANDRHGLREPPEPLITIIVPDETPNSPCPRCGWRGPAGKKCGCGYPDTPLTAPMLRPEDLREAVMLYQKLSWWERWRKTGRYQSFHGFLQGACKEASHWVRYGQMKEQERADLAYMLGVASSAL